MDSNYGESYFDKEPNFYRSNENASVKKSIIEIGLRKKYEQDDHLYKSDMLFRYCALKYRVQFPILNLNFKVDFDLEE